MDSGVTIIGIITVLICIFPFILMARSRKIKNEQMLNSLFDLAKSKNCSITNHEICGELLVGIDENKGYFFLYKKNSNGAINQAINLSDIKSCEIINTKNKMEVIQKLELKFLPENSKQPEVLAEFYNHVENFQLAGEMQLINKWHELILKAIKKEKK